MSGGLPQQILAALVKTGMCPDICKRVNTQVTNLWDTMTSVVVVCPLVTHQVDHNSAGQNQDIVLAVVDVNSVGICPAEPFF